MALSVQNASVKSWTQGTGTLILEQPTGNVTVTCQANINNYTLSIQTKLNGTNAQISGATSVRVYKSNTTTKPSSPTVTLTTNSSGYCSTSVTYLQYYWIEVYNYSGGSWTTLASAEQMPYNNVLKVANYYSVTATTGTYTSGASVSHSPVLSGTSVTFTATKGSATGYTYSDTITWTGTLTSFTSTSGQASAGKQITAQTTMDATCTRTANKYSLTIRSDNIRVTYGGTNYNDEAVINNITYGSSVSFTYTVLNSATYSGANIKYNNNSTSQNYTKSGTTITFTMPAGNSVLFIGASTVDTEEDLLQVKYNTNTQLSYLASKYSLTNATSSVDGSIVFNLSTASNYWRINASTVDENASGYSSVYLASTVGGVNFTSNFVLEQRKIEMYTYYTFTLSKGTGVASTSPASIIRVRRATGSSASENTKTVTINPSTGYGRTYSYSLSPTGACTTSLSGNVLTISNATADATITFTSTKLQYTVTFYANGHGTAPSAYVGVEYGSKISEPTAPSALGYTFGGWYKESACTNAWNFSTDTVTSNRDLYAKWTAQNFTLSIRTQGLTVKYNNTTYANGSSVSIPAGTSVTMTYTLDEDYVYSGAEIWYNTNQHVTCGHSGSSITFTMPTYNTTLLAGATFQEESIAYISYNEAYSLTSYPTASFSLTNAIYPGDGSTIFTITGTGTYWTVSADQSAEDTTGYASVYLKSGSYVSSFVLETLTVTMHTSYTITVQSNNTNYGTVSPTSWTARRGSTFSVSSNTFSCGGRTCTATAKSATAQYTFAFSSWSGVPSGGLTGNVTITANFSATTRTYTVTFTRNNSSYGTLSTYSVANVPYGTVLSTSSNTCSCNGTTVTATPASQTAQYTYTFGSWTNGTATVQGNTTVTANFTATTRTYTVTVSPSPTSYSSSSTTTLTAIPYGASISTSGNTITVGSKSATMNPIANSGNYTYYLYSWSKSSGTITGDITIYAYFSRHEINVTISQGNMASAYEYFSNIPRTVAYNNSVTTTLTLDNSYGNRTVVDNSQSCIVGQTSGTEDLVAVQDVQGQPEVVSWIRIDYEEDEIINFVYVAPSSGKPQGNYTVYIVDRYNYSSVYDTLNLIFLPHTRTLYFSGTAGSYPSNVNFGTAFTISSITASGTIGTADTCIVEGTKITMSDGTYRNVEEIQPNDQILSYNPYTKEQCTTTVIYCAPVEETSDFYRIPFNNGYLDVTGKHGIWVNNEKTYINFASITNSGVDTVDDKNNIVHVEPAIEMHSETSIKSYKLITSLGLYYTNGILSVHRARNKYDVLGQLVQNLDDRVIGVFEQDLDEYTKFDHLKHSTAYQNAYEVFKPRREYYNNIIFEEFSKLGVNIKAITPTDHEGKKHYYKTMVAEYPKYIGQSSVLDEAMNDRIELNDEWIATQESLLGMPVVTRPALFKRCFLRDLAIEDIIKEEDFTFEE